jgi:choice-of-anchor C domain-containing protein
MTAKSSLEIYVLASLLALAIGNSDAAVFLNGSFESASVNPANSSVGFIGLNAGDRSITGWVVDRDNIDYIGPFWQASNGVRSIDLDGVHPGSISQTFDTVTGATYQVGFDLAGNPDGPPTIKRMEVSAGNASAIFQFDLDGHQLNSMGYEHHVFSFQATASSSTLKFSSLTNPNGSLPAFGPALDNVTVSLAVPEPNLLVLLLASLVSFATWRRLVA